MAKGLGFSYFLICELDALIFFFGFLLLYGEYIMRNAGLEEAQAGIKIAGRNINNLTLIAEEKRN